MDASETEPSGCGPDSDKSAKACHAGKVQEKALEDVMSEQPSETSPNQDKRSEASASQQQDSKDAEACPPQTQKQDQPTLDETPQDAVTEHRPPEARSDASPSNAPADAAPPAAGTAAGGSDGCYRYEGERCVYTDPSSGLEYVYNAEQGGWLRRDGGGDGEPVHAPTLENCYYEGEHYCFRDAAGVVYRLDPASNSWERWTAPDASAAPADSAAAAAAAGAPASDDGRCYRDASGAWCCRDDAGAVCRWDAAAGRWARAEWPAPGGRKRRLNRGSSDDSEHDSDEEAPAAKRGPAAAGSDTQTTAEETGAAAAGGSEAAADGTEAPGDGSGYEWDAEKGAWFPKIDEEFLALHRLNYGFDAEGRAVETAPILESAAPPPEPQSSDKQLAGKQRKINNKKKPEWFQLDDSKNTKVYVTGLPDDTTEDEFVELMSKCGLVMKDPLKRNAWKVKLYRDDYGVPKGDGICTYIKIESVNLALTILDGYEFKGKKISVEKATFDIKGSFDPSKKPKKRALKKKDKEKLQKKQEKLFAWQPDKIRGERERHERVVILKNLFSPDEFKTHPEMILEYQQDLREECGKCGPVRKVVLHDRHKDGVAEVIFEDAADADTCVLKMNARWFAGRRLGAATWDGKTKYRVEETEEERAERLAKWEQFITGEDDKPSEDKPSDDKPSENKPPDSKPPEDKPSEDKPSEDKPSEDKPSEGKSPEDTSSKDKSSAEGNAPSGAAVATSAV